MKKIFAITVLTLVSVSAMAGFNGGNQQNRGGNGNGQVAIITTIAQAKQASEDSPVVLTGYIVKQIDHDEFIFKDSTGEIIIDVDDHAWNGLNVTSRDKITIQGTVDDDSEKSIDVYHIQK